MPVVHCPHCRTELDLDDVDVGYRVQCPACHSAFTPEVTDAPAQTAPPPLPPPPPPDTRTQVVTCPECQKQVAVATEDLGHLMLCPLCDEQFIPSRSDNLQTSPEDSGDGYRVMAERDEGPPWRREREDDDYDRRRRRSLAYRRDEDESPRSLIRYAKAECSASAVGLIVVGALTILFGALRLVLVGGVLATGATDEDEQLAMAVGIAVGVYSLVMGAFVVYAGSRMREAKNYPLCMIGCVLVLIPGISPCCILGLVFGIMGITKLNDGRVKRGFEANRPGYDPDAAA